MPLVVRRRFLLTVIENDDSARESKLAAYMDPNILLVEVTSELFDESPVARVDNQIAILSELIEETFRFEVGGCRSNVGYVGFLGEGGVSLGRFRDGTALVPHGA